MPSPVRDPPIPSLNPSLLPELQAPPSPRTHRALRRLQSAHTLGGDARAQAAASGGLGMMSIGLGLSANPPSLLSKQRSRERQQRNASPTRSQGVVVHRGRGRANSDATPPLVHQMNVLTAAKRSGNGKPVFSHGHLTLQQIVRDGPTDGDYVGALETARWKVIDEGVKAAEDGMVCFVFPHSGGGTCSLTASLVNTEDIRLARPARRAYHVY